MWSQVQAYRWFTIDVTGRDCHTGTTDFSNRSDALLTSAKLILHSHRLAASKGCLASTGIIEAAPGSTNTVPGRVRFSLDIRSTEDSTLSALEEDLKQDFDRIAANAEADNSGPESIIGKGCSLEWSLDTDSEAIKFDNRCIECVEDSAKELFKSDAEGAIQRMTSGAGHDSVSLTFN